MTKLRVVLTAPRALGAGQTLTWRRLCTATAVAAAGAVVLAACSSSGGGSSSSGTGGGSAPKPTITVALGAIDPVFTQVYVAKYNGFFDKEGVNVDIKQVGANALTTVVAGQADLGWSAAAAFVPPKSGKQTSIIYGGSIEGISGFMAGGKKITDPSQCKKVGALGPGTAVYRWAQIFAQAYGVTYDIVPLQDYPTILAAVLSGRVDCAVATNTIFAPKLADKSLNTLIDLRDKDALHAGIPKDVLDSMVWGMTDTMKAKSDAIVKFLKGLQDAANYMKSASPDDITALLQKSDDFKAVNKDTLLAGVTFDLPFLAPNNGQVDESAWPDQINFWSSTDTYGQRVDMSYLQKANG